MRLLAVLLGLLLAVLLGLLLTVRRLLGLTVLPAPSVLLAILLLAVRLCGSLFLFLCCFTGIFFRFGDGEAYPFGIYIESVYFLIVLCTGI